LFAEENYNMVFKQFQYGLSTNVDVIDANTVLVSGQRGFSNAQYDYQLAILGWVYAIYRGCLPVHQLLLLISQKLLNYDEFGL
jgi:outer membrane protein TolC